MAQQVVDFSDIYTMVMNELQLDVNSTTYLNRVKRIINSVYIQEVVPFKRWKWLSGETSVVHSAYLSTGTVSVTNGSTTATLSAAPATSKATYLFSVDGSDEIYTISAHTAATTTLTLDAAFTGTTNATANYKIWTDNIILPTDCRETVEVWHDHRRFNLDPLGLQEFRRRVNANAKVDERPYFYTPYDYVDPSSGTGETESDRYRVLKIYPSLSTEDTVLHIDYIKEVSALNADADEPVLPLEDRIVLVYGALAIAWSSVVRNPEETARNAALYDRKLTRMAGQVDESRDYPQLTISNDYIAKKRGRFRLRRLD